MVSHDDTSIHTYQKDGIKAKGWKTHVFNESAHACDGDTAATKDLGSILSCFTRCSCDILLQ